MKRILLAGSFFTLFLGGCGSEKTVIIQAPNESASLHRLELEAVRAFCKEISSTEGVPQTIPCLKSAIRKSAKNEYLYYQLAVEQKNLSLKEEALSSLEQAIALSPREFEFHYLKGEIYYYANDYVRAEAAYSAVLAIDPENEEAYISRGITYSHLMKNESYLSDMNQAVKFAKRPRYALWRRANANVKLNHYAEALADCDRVIEFNRTDTKVFILRGNINSTINTPVSIGDYTEALRLGVTDKVELADVHFRRGLSYIRVGKAKESIDDFTKTIELSSNPKVLADAYYFRGNSQDEIKKGEGDADHKKAEELLPGISQKYSS